MEITIKIYYDNRNPTFSARVSKCVVFIVFASKKKAVETLSSLMPYQLYLTTYQ